MIRSLREPKTSMTAARERRKHGRRGALSEAAAAAAAATNDFRGGIFRRRMRIKRRKKRRSGRKRVLPAAITRLFFLPVRRKRIRKRFEDATFLPAWLRDK